MLPTLSDPDRHTGYLDYLSRIAATHEPVAKARVAAAMTYKRDIVSVGVNRLKSDPFQARFGKNEESIYLHAEIAAIKNAIKFLSGEELARAVLYICRLKYTDESRRAFQFGLVKPCRGCQKAIRHFGIRHVIFTTDQGSYQSLLS